MLFTEAVLALSSEALAAVEELTGQSVCRSTIHNWFQQGIRFPGGERVRLEVWRVGRQVVTTRAALERFLVRVGRLKQESAAVA